MSRVKALAHDAVQIDNGESGQSSEGKALYVIIEKVGVNEIPNSANEYFKSFIFALA